MTTPPPHRHAAPDPLATIHTPRFWLAAIVVSFFGLLAKFEPMHQVFLGARALLYFDDRADAGLSRGLTLSAIGLVIGLLIGGVVTRIYDHRGLHRSHAEVDET